MKHLEFSKVQIHGGFWREKQRMLKEVTVGAVYDRFKETHRFEALSCKWQEGMDWKPHIFWDSDVAKWMEGVAYILKTEENRPLQEILEQVIDELEQNRTEDGYYNSYYLSVAPEERFTNRDRHELYCLGHWIEAAVAYYDATGRDRLLRIVCRYADLTERLFKEEGTPNYVTPGHPELELALIRLYEATGEQRYADLAKFFIDQHGANEKDYPVIKWSRIEYNMDGRPLRAATEPRGHAVRALYLLSGALDVARIFGDEELLAACERCYESIVRKRMYITGGVGSTREGEAFTVDYHLPPRTAYAETCAAISLIYFCHRLLSQKGQAKYADTLERALYNGVLSGISMEGDSFFYVNPLEIDLTFNQVHVSTDHDDQFPRTRRPKVFNCSCCPPNLVRLLASVGGYAYSEDEDTLYIHQFMDSTLTTEGTTLTLQTAYPADGKLRLSWQTDKKTIAIRKPDWCKGFSASLPYEERDGYLLFDAGSCKLELMFEMPVRVLYADPHAHEMAGRVAVMRGPIVYCAEGIDNGENLKAWRLLPEAGFSLREGRFLLPELETRALVPNAGEELYSEEQGYEEKRLHLIPYYAFANREETDLQVWFLR